MLPELTALANDPAVAASAKREAFYKTGIELIEDEICPFCDDQWDLGKLKEHVQRKINHLEDVTRRRTAVVEKLAAVTKTLGKVQFTIKTLLDYAGLATPPIEMAAARDYITNCKNTIEKLTVLIPLSETVTLLPNIAIVPQTVFDDITELEKVVMALPEPTKQESASEWLTVAQERFEVLCEELRKQKIAEHQAKTTRQLSDIYAKTSDTVLAGIYTAVQKDFASLYAFINRDDESQFKAHLVPSLGKLGFDVDFYGRGFFPPGAYHSEGHQDGMGLCLYLALMKYLQGSRFTFAVLDDVLMSVDVGHRREVCSLLKNEFPNTQFIMTTHDPIWLRHMKTEKLIKSRSAVQFRNWDVNLGPLQWDDRDVWTEIEDHLKENKVQAASALLRNYLEYISTELCHRLRAPVEFRGDGRFELGDLLPAAIARMRKIYSRAKDAASSWNQKDVLRELTAREAEFARLAELSNAEQWQVNVAIHYNSWDNLCREDFSPVAKAFQNLLTSFTCPQCGEYLRVLPDRQTLEELRCDCSKTAINLLKCKKKQ